MGMKKSVKLALAAAMLIGSVSTTFASNEQTADEARERLGMLKPFFKDKGLSGFAFLNGLDEVGGEKNRTQEAGLQWAELTKSDDSKATITCIQNGNYVVNQMQPTLVGKSAVTGEHIWRDGQGMPIVEKVEEAFKNSPDGWVSVKYVETTQRVNNEREGLPLEGEFELLAVNSKELGVDGESFFCTTRYIPLDQTDRKDNDDRTESPEEHGNGKMHKKHKKHHHHAKKAQAAEVKKADEKGAKTAAAA